MFRENAKRTIKFKHIKSINEINEIKTAEQEFKPEVREHQIKFKQFSQVRTEFQFSRPGQGKLPPEENYPQGKTTPFC